MNRLKQASNSGLLYTQLESRPSIDLYCGMILSNPLHACTAKVTVLGVREIRNHVSHVVNQDVCNGTEFCIISARPHWS